jgi:hypothetical protein
MLLKMFKSKIMNKEMVNHPEHYQFGDDKTYEVVNVCEAWNLDADAYIFNVVKYVARAGLKDSDKEIQDLKKALWYLNRKIERLENGN